MTFAVGALLGLAIILQSAALALLWVRRARLAKAERAQVALDHAPVILWTARPDTTLDYLNGTCMEFTGLPIEQLRDEGWQSAAHPDDLESAIATYTPAIAARVPFTMEHRLRRADGAWRWMFVSGVPRYGKDGAFAGFVGCDVDITERKDAETRTQQHQAALEQSHQEIQKLAGRLIEAQDAERARLARDLHDDVSQQLAGLSISMSGLRHRMDELDLSDEIRDDLRSLHERATSLGWNVRHLSHDLHPTVLRHSGLVPALSSYCAEIGRLHGATASCAAEGDFVSLAPDAALCLYRIAQEAVRNVIAHAGASRVEVRLHRNNGHTELTITDDGKGFDVVGALARTRGLGLVSMTERARLAKGTVAITAGSGSGTCVQVRIPA